MLGPFGNFELIVVFGDNICKNIMNVIQIKYNMSKYSKVSHYIMTSCLSENHYHQRGYIKYKLIEK